MPKSRDGAFEYAPCRVTLVDGTVLDNVYVQEVGAYLRNWGDDPSRPFVSAAELALIEESPIRLPAGLAEKVYNAGESGMGYVKFVVKLRDGRDIPFLTGNAVDFLNWPEGVGPGDAVDVVTHDGRSESADRHGLTYLWCLFRASEGVS